MSNKKLIMGVAAGVALLTAAGIVLYRKKTKKQRFMNEAENLAENFKSKLNNLQRKAQKELKHTADSGEELANVAMERVNQWLNKASL